jgi:hypothetical protein
MTRRSSLPRLSLKTPLDVLATIPFVVGYHPAESIVLLGLFAQQMAFTLRSDLPLSDDAAERRAVVDHLVAVARRQRASAVLAVGYGPDDRVRPVLQQLEQACDRAGPIVLELLRVQDGRYWSYLCDEPFCCPTEGSPYDVSASATATAWTVAGLVALPDRRTYEGQLNAVTGPARVSMTAATARANDRLVALLADAADEAAAEEALLLAGGTAIREGLDRCRRGERLTDDEVGWLTVLLQSHPVRDVAESIITQAAGDLPHHRALWMDAMRRAEPDLVVGPGPLFALTAWRLGEGALARVAVERVLEARPYDCLSLYVGEMLAGATPPPGTFAPFKPRPGRPRRKGSSSRRARNRRA